MSQALIAAGIGLLGTIAGAFIQNGTGILCTLDLAENCDASAERAMIADLQSQRDRIDAERLRWLEAYTALLEASRGMLNEVERIESTNLFRLRALETQPGAMAEFCAVNQLLCQRYAQLEQSARFLLDNERLDAFAADIRGFDLPEEVLVPEDPLAGPGSVTVAE